MVGWLFSKLWQFKEGEWAHLLECLWWGGWPQARVWPTEDSWWRPLSSWPVPGWTLPLAPSSGTGWLSPQSYLPFSEPHTHYPGFPYTIPLERIGVRVEWQTMIIFWRIVDLIKVWQDNILLEYLKKLSNSSHFNTIRQNFCWRFLCRDFCWQSRKRN